MPVPDAPTLTYRFTIVAEVGEYLKLHQDAARTLELIPITGGTISGDLTGSVVPGGGDWCSTLADGSYEVEARYVFQTDDGALVDVVNTGILRHLGDQTGPPSEMGYFLTTPTFRTVAPDLQWLTRSLFLGKARTAPGATTIDIFEVSP